jgi:hypothetical protein
MWETRTSTAAWDAGNALELADASLPKIRLTNAAINYNPPME